MITGVIISLSITCLVLGISIGLAMGELLR